MDAKDHLRHYLDEARKVLLWKLDGLSEYDVRRPLTPTGTNLLGLVKHSAGVDAGYFGEVFGRPFPEPMPWMSETAETNADMWATTDESRADLIALYHRVWEHSNATIAALALDAIGQVPWWGADSEVTLHQILIHVTAETNRHAGHADIVRELIDGVAGTRANGVNLPAADREWWSAYHARLEEAAQAAR
ncbi:DinB family protein [Paractinoplanes ferrugineus]|nr:DinB family protein [Actinoplanes ferrugineus]